MTDGNSVCILNVYTFKISGDSVLFIFSLVGSSNAEVYQ